MPTDLHRTRRRCLRLVASGGLVSLTGCAGDSTENGDGADSSPATDSNETLVPPYEPEFDSDAVEAVRLSPVDDPREVWSTGLTAIYPTDLIAWLREVTSHDRTLRKRVSTSEERPNPPLQVLKHVHFIGLTGALFLTDPGDVTGDYELNIEAGPYYEMRLGAELADPPSDVEVTPVGHLGDERRTLVVAAIEGDAEESRVFSDTALAQWARESFIDNYYRYEDDTYRGHEINQTDRAAGSTEAWYELSAVSSMEYDDATYLLVPALVDTVRADLDAGGVPDRTDELVIEEPSEPLMAFADAVSMLVTHLTIFRMHLETETA